MQADSGASPAAPFPSWHQGSTAVWEMLNNIGPVAMAVLALLLIASLYSWAVIMGKMSLFGKATRESRHFIHAFRKALPRLQEISALADNYKFSPLAQVYEDIYDTYKRQTGGSGPPRNLAPLERSAQTSASEAVSGLERRMTWLATIAATSPFVGLFGTVIGIIDAFHGLGTAGAATLRAVAPGISEALITTAAGLFVAVPAVVAYNQFTARIRVFAAATDDFCRELLNLLEEIPARSAPPSRNTEAELPREAERGLHQ
ncbi:MAG: MotA/TolQ/ExbB proton channel family protein [Terracidiphilus sp.]